MRKKKNKLGVGSEPKTADPVVKAKEIQKEAEKNPLVGKYLGNKLITSVKDVVINGEPRQEVTVSDGSTYPLSEKDIENQIKKIKTIVE